MIDRKEINPRKALVLGTGFEALAVIHELDTAGITAIHLSTSRSDNARLSRHSHEKVLAYSPIFEERKLLKLLLDRKEEWQGSLLVPVDDPCTSFIAKNLHLLSRIYITSTLEWPFLKIIMIKKLLYILAQKIGVPTPKTFFPTNVQSLFQFKDKINFPCILKPYQKTRFLSLFNKKVLIINEFEELKENFLYMLLLKVATMISEIIPGQDSALFSYRSYIDRQGHLLAEMCTQKLRQHPPGFGVGCVQRTVPMIPEIKSHSMKLLRSIKYTGLSSVEFKLDSRDNQYKLMEINTRPAMAQKLFNAAGVNFSYVAYMDLVENVKLKPTYVTAVYFINNVLDKWELLSKLKGRLKDSKDFFLPYRQKRKVYAVPLFDEPFVLMKMYMDMAISILKNHFYKLKMIIRRNKLLPPYH